MSSTATETSLLRTRSAIHSFQASKTPQTSNSKASTTSTEGNYGPYFSLVEEPYEMRKIVAESASLAGGVAAVLLQIAHPAGVAGVAAHSSFTYRRIERARRSVVYIYCMTFGTSEEKRQITDATHRAHAQVKGKEYDAKMSAHSYGLQRQSIGVWSRAMR